MGDFIRLLVNLQVNAFASSPTAAAIFVIMFDCLLVYACLFLARRKVSQAEFGAFIVVVVAVVLVSLEFVGAVK